MLVIVPSRKMLPRKRRSGKVPKEIPPHPFGAFCSARSSPPKKFASLEDDSSKWGFVRTWQSSASPFFSFYPPHPNRWVRSVRPVFTLNSKESNSDIHNRRAHSLQTKKELSCQKVLEGVLGGTSRKKFPLTHPPRFNDWLSRLPSFWR